MDSDSSMSFSPLEEKIPKIPEPAQAAKDPHEILTCEELYLTGLHIEQYRHATYLPDDYYLEGLKRDEGDIRLNTAYGMLLFRRGLLEESERHFLLLIRPGCFEECIICFIITSLIE